MSARRIHPSSCPFHRTIVETDSDSMQGKDSNKQTMFKPAPSRFSAEWHKIHHQDVPHIFPAHAVRVATIQK